MPGGMIQRHLTYTTRAEEICISRGKKLKQSHFVKLLNEQTREV